LNCRLPVARFVANSVAGRVLDKLSDRTAHGGTVIYDKDSRSAKNHWVAGSQAGRG
jgi:hypothetical protein